MGNFQVKLFIRQYLTVFVLQQTSIMVGPER